MPATEQTWRDQNRLNLIFGLTSLILLGSTVLMFYRDHSRPWKRIQPKAVSLDNKVTLWRQEQFQTLAAEQKHAELQEAVLVAASQPIAQETFDAFIAAMGKEGGKTESLQSLYADFQKKAGEAAGKTGKELVDASDLRNGLVAQLTDIVERAKRVEENALRDKKFASAHLDAAKAVYDLGIRDNAPDLSTRMDKVQSQQKTVEDLNTRYQVLSQGRKDMEGVLKKITAGTDAAKKAVADDRAGLERLRVAYQDKEETYGRTFLGFIPLPGKEWLNLPIVDAFGTRRKIDNLWADGLEQDYNFRKVRRFDRCTTCHQLMQKTLPGQPTTPAYDHQTDFDLVIAGEIPADDGGKKAHEALEEFLGLRLANEGLISSDEVAVKYVRAESPGAQATLATGAKPAKLPTGLELRQQAAAYVGNHDDGQPSPGLQLGDVIAAVNGQKVRGAGRIAQLLLAEVREKKSVRLTVRRGLAHPYASHPRLDLFVGDSSPHPMGKFACTICHDGQGSATEFKWASHTPNTQAQGDEWRKEHGWFDNPHWIYPMYPQRFAESACLKCHHNVIELEPSDKFPQGPAEKVVHGYHLITKYGCYGCHEVNGYDGPTRRVGPDLRSEPNFFAVAQQAQHEARGAISSWAQDVAALAEKAELKSPDAKGSALTQMVSTGQGVLAAVDAAVLAKAELSAKLGDAYSSAKRRLDVLERFARQSQRLIERPDDNDARRALQILLEEDALAAKENNNVLPAGAHRLAGQLKDVEAPGSLRKPGPSLRFLATKVDDTFLYDWLENPKNFRPNTRMPRFFGLWDHLKDHHGEMKDHAAPKMEPVEIRAMMVYLKGQSQQHQPLPRAEGIDKTSLEQQIARGRQAFEIRGCLACHTHKDFAAADKFRTPGEIVQGPDLSNIAAKFSADRNPQGPDWLYSWIKEPTRYHARTVMPNLFLEPERIPDLTKQPNEKGEYPKITVDTADDVTAYLLSVTPDWKPSENATKPADSAAIRELTLQNLKEAVYDKAAEDHAQRGIPADMAGEFKGVEQELVVSRADYNANTEISDEQRLRYLGRKTIAKYGCFGCHDIPGFEDAKPIGTGLADWGRKDPAKLAFEHITHYIEHGHGHAAHGHGHDAPHSAAETKDHDWSEGDEHFYRESLEAGHRPGFIYQKLKEPRSYDFEKTENKRYNERLRMPQFPFTAAEREAVIAFVLGLVADPPQTKYVYQPSPRQTAIQQGRVVLEKYNCGGCHVLEGERWELSYPKSAFSPQDLPADYHPLLRAAVSTKALEAAAKADAAGRLHSRVEVLPKLSDADGLPSMIDEDGGLDGESEFDPVAVKQELDLWKPAHLGGSLYSRGVQTIRPEPQHVEERFAARGGQLTRYLLPIVTQLEKTSNPNAKGSEAWGWLPPPLIGEGEKVQTAWLHDFLLNPYPIRPAVFLRMPKFNMSSAEASALVAYFAAVDNASYPYEYGSRRESARLEAKELEYRQVLAAAGEKPGPSARFTGALKLLAGTKDACIQCHSVADFKREGAPRGNAPNLADVYRRLRPEYVRQWVVRPTSLLPYTAMPPQFKYDPNKPLLGAEKQASYRGDSLEQLEAVVDLLMNFDTFSHETLNVKSIVPKDVGEPPPAAGAGTGEAGN